MGSSLSSPSKFTEVGPGMYINLNKITKIEIIKNDCHNGTFYMVYFCVENTKITTENCRDYRFNSIEEAKVFVNKFLV